MSGQWHGGKGSSPRKQQDKKAYDDGWDRIFGKRDRSEPKGDTDKNGTNDETKERDSSSNVS